MIVIVILHVLFSTELTDFRLDKSFRRFTYKDGRLTATVNGVYYIYAQAFFESYPNGPSLHNQVALSVNGIPVSVLQTGLGGSADYGSVNTGRLVPLHEGDYISLVTIDDSRMWVTEHHTFFGANRVSKLPRA